MVLPLRCFLGLTFTYAGLQKLANPDYLDPHSPTSVASQMRALRHSSPIGLLVGLSTHAPTLVGLLIAFAELAVGVGTLLGLYARIAAIGGILLSLTFFLTVSWNTTPYYYGSDIVFVFAWITMFAFGTGDVLCIEAWVRNRVRSSLRIGPPPAEVRVSATRLRNLCPRAGGCGLQDDGACGRRRGCPVFPTGERLPPGTSGELDRRTALQTGTVAVLTAGGAALVGGATAWLGRAAGGTRRSPAALGPAVNLTPSSAQAPTGSPTVPAHSATPSGPVGTFVGTTAEIPVGQARQFTDPATGAASWMVHVSRSTFVAFNGTCTHAGCPVQYQASTMEFVCPCHGGVYDARTGKVLQGPPPAPLQAIPVHVDGRQLRVGD